MRRCEKGGRAVRLLLHVAELVALREHYEEKGLFSFLITYKTFDYRNCGSLQLQNVFNFIHLLRIRKKNGSKREHDTKISDYVR